MKTTKDLPDLDTLNPDAIAQLAETARVEQATLERIWAALSDATLDDKLQMAALAIINVSECTHIDPLVRAEHSTLFSDLSDEALVSLAIAILENVQTEAGEDVAIVHPDCNFRESFIEEPNAFNSNQVHQ